MRLLGFEHEDICRELIALHKIYGNTNWAFVEMDSCKILLDALLDAQEKGARLPQNGNENKILQEEAEVGENAIAVPVAADSGPPNPHFQASSSAVLGAVPQPSDASLVVEDVDTKEGEIGGLMLNNYASLSLSPPLGNNSLIPSFTAAAPCRKPCYGWIGDSDDSEDEVVILPPASCRFGTRNPENGNGEVENKPK